MHKERIPDLLVRVYYEVPPTRGVFPMYFEDYDDRQDYQYGEAVKALYPNAVVRGVERHIKPRAYNQEHYVQED